MPRESGNSPSNGSNALAKLIEESCGLPLFRIGKLYITSELSAHVNSEYRELCDLVDRHVTGDFGDICKFDECMNICALKSGCDRIVSIFNFNGSRISVITEADRSYTTLNFLNSY